MENQPDKLTLTPSTGGDTFSVVGDTYRIVIAGHQTGGEYAVIDMLVPPGGGPGPHTHAQVQEAFYILQGEIVVKTEQEYYTARKGDFVNIPKGGIIHCFKNESAAIAHMLCVVTPAGMENMFREIGTPVAPGSFLPPRPPDEETLKRFTAIAEKYGQQLYPPDYLDKK